MSAKNASLLLASLALLSLGFNLYKRVFTANETLRCAGELHVTRRHTKLVRSRLNKAVATLADLNQTIAGLTAGEAPVDTAANHRTKPASDIEDLVAKISALEKANNEVKTYLLMLQEDTKGAEQEASLSVKTGGKLTDEINDLREELKRLKRELKKAVRKDISQ
ncbi:uncharacterized protein LOC119744382 [Patiria miniata]|uniref:Uncharacterized protein n=1 Tax=Patiria miniata TaxID=46514 RepID=A0A914BL68_PATMI|nr:uncharacterized protein LOC119744382 [Patiria miniata]